MYSNNKNKLMGIFLGVIQAFIGITAIAGGLRMVSNPNGLEDIPIEWLIGSPFTSYFIPGLMLLIVIGFGNVFSSVFTFLRKGYSGLVSALLGIFLIIFMTAEVYFVGLQNFLQPLYFILGFIVLYLGYIFIKSTKKCLGLEAGSVLDKLQA